MYKLIQKSSIKYLAIAMLLLFCGTLNAQTVASVKEIPTNVKQSASAKAVSKSNNVSNDALTNLDTASNKAFRGFKGLFRKKNRSKNKNPQDSTSSPSSSICRKSFNYLVIQAQEVLEDNVTLKYSLHRDFRNI